VTYAVAHLDELDRIPLAEGIFRPVRHALGVSAFGINAYTGENTGDHVIETHDETSAGAGAHEELYFVAAGEAAFEIDGEQVAAPAGTMLLIPPGTMRGATAAAPGTTVLVIGGKPGSSPVSPFEYWYLAEPADPAGDYARAYAIASAGLAAYPDHPTLNYQLACYQALAGDRAKAIEHLEIAYAGDPRTREWAADDDDLASVRDDPALR
jgi:mannose-6-phosphate isomerase-like protein (cupin superfamily)